MPLEFPITVNALTFAKSEMLTPPLYGAKVGSMVSIRPCAAEYGDKTYLGVMLGDLALGQSVTFNKETGTLHVEPSFRNPAIFVPDLNKIILGCESWWGVIKDGSQLKNITNQDIENVWYVKALKDLAAAEDAKVASSE